MGWTLTSILVIVNKYSCISFDRATNCAPRHIRPRQFETSGWKMSYSIFLGKGTESDADYTLSINIDGVGIKSTAITPEEYDVINPVVLRLLDVIPGQARGNADYQLMES